MVGLYIYNFLDLWYDQLNKLEFDEGIMTLMRKDNKKDNKNDKNDKVQYLPIGMCLGLSIGAALGNISMGICIGLAIGAGIDFLHNKKNDDSKSNDEHEE